MPKKVLFRFFFFLHAASCFAKKMSRKTSAAKYIIPSIGGLFVTYLYNVVDDIFVARGTGSAGLGAVNRGVPFITTAAALASMFPMGGAVLVSICMGKKDYKGASRVFMNALISTLILSCILMVIGMVFPPVRCRSFPVPTGQSAGMVIRMTLRKMF